jgi:hypothetical protein
LGWLLDDPVKRTDLMSAGLVTVVQAAPVPRPDSGLLRDVLNGLSAL